MAAEELAALLPAGAPERALLRAARLWQDLDPTEHVDLSPEPRYNSTLALLQQMLAQAEATYFQSPGSKTPDKAAVTAAKARGGFW